MPLYGANRMPGQAASAQDLCAALGREEGAVIHSGGYSRLSPLPPFAQRVYERHQLQAELRQIVLDPQRIAFESRTAHDAGVFQLAQFQRQYPVRDGRVVSPQVAEALGAVLQIISSSVGQRPLRTCIASSIGQ